MNKMKEIVIIIRHFALICNPRMHQKHNTLKQCACLMNVVGYNGFCYEKMYKNVHVTSAQAQHPHISVKTIKKLDKNHSSKINGKYVEELDKFVYFGKCGSEKWRH